MGRGSRILKILFASKKTWLAVIITVLLEGAFIFWFQPGSLMLFAAAGAGLLSLLLWPVIYFRSDQFRRLYHGIPEAMEDDDLKRLLAFCEPEFREPALECLALAEKIRREFRDQGFIEELDSMLTHLYQLAQNHTELYQRAQTFGTDDQKQAMHRMLSQQAESVEGALTAMKRFSGNLTLFDLRMKDQKEIDTELKAINMGLQDALKEV